MADGVTINLGLLNSIVYHKENSTASIGPGGHWGDVYLALDRHGVTVAGGRDATVGVGGFLTGGGNSFSTARKGWACDTIRRFEVVLADGDVVVADEHTNADLFLALKGGGGSGNLGIVTRFDMEAFQGSRASDLGWDYHISNRGHDPNDQRLRQVCQRAREWKD